VWFLIREMTRGRPERQQSAAEIGGYLMQVRQNNAEGLRLAVEFDHKAAFRWHHQFEPVGARHEFGKREGNKSPNFRSRHR